MLAKEAKKRLADIPDNAQIIIAWYEKSDADVDVKTFNDDEAAKLDSESWEKLTKVYDFETGFYDDIRDAIFTLNEEAKAKERKF